VHFGKVDWCENAGSAAKCNAAGRLDCCLQIALQPQAKYMEGLLQHMRMGVMQLWGGTAPNGMDIPENTGCIVCTIEKANTLVNRLLEDNMLGSLSCVVVDELHMVRCAEYGTYSFLGSRTMASFWLSQVLQECRATPHLIRST